MLPLPVPLDHFRQFIVYRAVAGHVHVSLFGVMPLVLHTRNPMCRIFAESDPMATVHLPLLIETDEDGVYIVSCPVFRGCHSYGATVEEAMANIREAIALCMEEKQPDPINRFVGFREIEVPVRMAS